MSYIFKNTTSVISTGENVLYTDESIISKFDYHTTQVTVDEESGIVAARPLKLAMEFKTQRKIPRTGVMFVGW